MKELEHSVSLTPSQEENRDYLVEEAREGPSLRGSPILSSSGREIEAYSDFDLLVGDPIDADKIVRLFSEEIEKIAAERPIGYLGVIEKMGNTTGAISLAAALSIETGIPFIVIRIWKDVMSERIKSPSAVERSRTKKLLGKNVVIITDHSTGGAELVEAIDTIRYVGGNVTDAIAYSVHKKHLLERKSELEQEEMRIHYFVEIPDTFTNKGIERAKVYA